MYGWQDIITLKDAYLIKLAHKLVQRTKIKLISIKAIK